MKVNTLQFVLLLSFTGSSAAIAQQCETCPAPANHKFRLQKNATPQADTNVVKTSGLYVAMAIDMASYTYLRFFPDGRVYASCKYCSFPGTDELSNLQYGNYGRYKLDSDQVTIENHTIAGGYFYTYYTIAGNELVLQATQKRPHFLYWPKRKTTDKITYRFFKRALEGSAFW